MTVDRALISKTAIAMSGVLVLTIAAAATPPAVSTLPTSRASAVITRPPEAFFQSVHKDDRDAARAFYAKYLDLGGVPVVAGAAVDDAALLRTYDIVTHMLAGRPDLLRAMARKGTRLIVIGRGQVYTDMPEYRHEPNPAYMNERVRGTGGLDVTSFGEENLLNLPIDRYDDESIAVHEFCHTIDAALRSIDPGWEERLRGTYRHAIGLGRWHLAYTASNEEEYWAEIGQSYFDCNRTNNWNHANVGTREQLKEYDPEGYELVRTTLNLTGPNDWRFVPLRPQPSVIPPPPRFHIDPHYTKFTWSRELPIVASSKVTDAALLRANGLVRKLFAYRHDVLKAIINDGGKLVILGRGERLAELPELQRRDAVPPAGEVRYLDYTNGIMAVPEENVLNEVGDPLRGASSVVRAMSRAAYKLTATRPVDPDWDRRPPDVWQQYELRVQRLDKRFGDRVKALFDQAAARKLWRGTPAGNDPMSYWSNGVEAYFDAAGSGYAPVGAARPIVTREALRVYDPDLYDLVDQTFAYGEHVDWRYVHVPPHP